MTSDIWKRRQWLTLYSNHTAATAYLVGQMGWKRLAAEYHLDDSLSKRM